MKRRLVLILLGLLVCVTAAYAQDVTVEDNGSIEVGDTVTGEFSPGVRQSYMLEVEDTPVINIFLDGDADMDTYLRVYNEGEDEPFAENDDRGDGSLFSALEGLEVNPGDVLVIEAGTFADEGEGAFQLRVMPPPTVEDTGEITLGDTVEGTFAENSRYRYNLDVEDGGALSILLEGAEDLDTYLRIYREGEDIPAIQNDDIELGDLSSGFTSLIVPSGTSLVLEAGTYGDAGTGDYTLTVEETDVDVPAADTPIEWTEESTTDDVCADAADAEEPTRLQYFAPEDMLEEGVDYGAVFCTEAGNFRIDLYEAEAPITVNSFVYLASNHFFDQTTFHRVIPDFVVQGGDPTGSGSGGPGYEYVNETDNDLTFGGIGVVGMANAGPDTNGSQFFITLAPVARLDGGYTIFGQVQEGIAAVTDVEERDPSTAEEPGTALYSVVIITVPPAEE